MKHIQLTNYKVYRLSIKEIIGYSMAIMLIMFLASYLFYRHLIFSILISPLAIFFLPYINRRLIEKRKKLLKEQFKEGIYALSSSISVGKSVESAFVDTLEELALLETQRHNYILNEFEIIVRKINNNERIEEALKDFAMRACDEDITDFVNVFIIANRTGGNLIEIMKFTINIINEKMEVDAEINILLAEKRFEQRLMGLLLPFIVIYLQFFLDGFIAPLYSTVQGRISMTIVLMLYGISFYIGSRIVNIKV